MAITKKPQPSATERVAELQVEATTLDFIKKGMSAPPQADDSHKLKRMQLRLMPDCIKVIDSLRNRHSFSRMSRHAWIIAAIEEKIERERSS